MSDEPLTDRETRFYSYRYSSWAGDGHVHIHPYAGGTAVRRGLWHGRGRQGAARERRV